MQIGKDGFFHLSYCTNIHPGERWDEVFRNLKQYLPTLKLRMSPDRPFGVGLRLSNAAANDLLEGDVLPGFKDWLDENGLYVYTINGFPHGGFHGRAVKDKVYEPDWRSAERVDYTLRLARILADLLPEDVDGGISTSPISYKPWLNARERREALEHGAIHLALLTAALAQLRDQTDRLIHVDIEPEPNCLLENMQETVGFFCNWLLPRGGNVMIVDDLLDHI
ncbi:MAG TPA: metabolite traffic protein EboE, partial [Rhodothermales bacterium]|nr:metabolite traffic protein EboE [Rhodothermales bacterium]